MRAGTVPACSPGQPRVLPVSGGRTVRRRRLRARSPTIAAVPLALGDAAGCAEGRESGGGERGWKDGQRGVVSEVFREQAGRKRE